jgi:Tfp pilus assembly PilM family ATPase
MATAVGLDIGARGVRAIALDGTRLAGHAEVPRFNDDGTERPLATIIAELAAALPLGRPIAASSELEVLARFLHLAPLPAERLERIIRLELSPDEGPAPAMDAVRLAVPGDDIVHLGLIAQTADVRMLQNDVQRAGVRLRALSWGPLAVATVGMRADLEGDQIALVVDIGTAGSDIALVQSGRLLACRRIAIGGQAFTQALVDSGMTPAEAERSKCAPPAPAAPAMPAPAPVPVAPVAPVAPADDGLELPGIDDGSGLALALEPPAPPPAPVETEAEAELVLDDAPAIPRAPGSATVQIGSSTLGPALSRAAEQLYGQLSTTLAFFRAQLKRNDLAPARVLLCGGGAGLAALEPYLARRFQVPVARLDPCAGLGGTAPAEPWRWARAVGLAQQAAGGDVPVADLRPEAELRREAWVKRLVWPWVAAACLLTSGAIAAIGLSERVGRDEAEAVLLERAVADHKRLSAELAALEAERNALQEDLRAVAGRIYAARDLLYTVRALKELTGEAKELWITKLQTVAIGRDDAEVPTLPTTGTRWKPGQPAAQPRKDSLIERGAIDLSGRVRFDTAKTDPDLVAFSEKYQRDLQEWKTPEGTPLFRTVDLTNRVIERAAGTVAGKEGGEFTFTFRGIFPATSLAGEGAKPESQP